MLCSRQSTKIIKIPDKMDRDRKYLGIFDLIISVDLCSFSFVVNEHLHIVIYINGQGHVEHFPYGDMMYN